MCSRDFEVRYRYANGVDLLYRMAGRPYVRFEGTEGWIEAEWWKGTTQRAGREILQGQAPDRRSPTAADQREARFHPVAQRRGRKRLIPAESGHRTAGLCHLGWIAIQVGGRLKWDPDAERFTNSDEANGLLSRPMREPWTLLRFRHWGGCVKWP